MEPAWVTTFRQSSLQSTTHRSFTIRGFPASKSSAKPVPCYDELLFVGPFFITSFQKDNFVFIVQSYSIHGSYTSKLKTGKYCCDSIVVLTWNHAISTWKKFDMPNLFDGVILCQKPRRTIICTFQRSLLGYNHEHWIYSPHYCGPADLIGFFSLVKLFKPFHTST